jgi:twitching motility two-component system response regulator PilH
MAASHLALRRDRRRRSRARISLGVHIRGGIGTLEAFEDFATSLDVSRDGILLSTPRSGYWVGQSLEVSCPFWKPSDGINTSRGAKVVRSVLTSLFNYAVAVEFQRQQDDGNSEVWAPTPYPNQVRVLGIEHEPRAARVMKGLLEQDGYVVLYVSTAEQALDVLRSEIPNVLVAESEGVGISGLDLCAIVKTSERLQHIPVILLTRSAMPSDFSAGHRLEAVVCMMKPYQPVRLQRAIHMVAPPPSQQTVYSGRFNLGAFVRTS